MSKTIDKIISDEAMAEVETLVSLLDKAAKYGYDVEKAHAINSLNAIGNVMRGSMPLGHYFGDEVQQIMNAKVAELIAKL